MNFKRAFDEIPRVKSCESSGSEHSADLSDLVNSFLERETTQERRGDQELFDQGDDHEEMGSNSPDLESRDVLKNLFSYENDAVKRSIHEEVERAYGEAGGSSPDFKRRLMARLRSRGFDAGESIHSSFVESFLSINYIISYSYIYLNNYRNLQIEMGEKRRVPVGEVRIHRRGSRRSAVHS